MIDFLVMSAGGVPAPAPGEYIDMVFLPRQGYPYSEVKQLSVLERYQVLKLLEWEAQYTPKKRD